MVRHADMEATIMREEVRTHRSLEGGVLHRSQANTVKHQVQPGGRGGQRVAQSLCWGAGRKKGWGRVCLLSNFKAGWFK